MKKTYEVKGHLVEIVIDGMIDALKKRNRARVQYLNTSRDDISSRKALNTLCCEAIDEAYTIKRCLSTLFDIDVYLNYTDDDDLIKSIEVDGKTYEVE